MRYRDAQVNSVIQEKANFILEPNMHSNRQKAANRSILRLAALLQATMK
jgi:hypothetical protein